MKFTIAILAVLGSMVAGCASVTSDSEYNLGVHAYQGKNYEEARVHWERAVVSGVVLAENNLGYLLYFGLGGPKDRKRGFALWTKAASEGNSESQWHLGSVYEAGGVVPQSNVKAFAWYRCALATAENREQKDETERLIANDARRSLEKLLSKLSPEEFGSAQSLANEYIARYGHARSKT